jgi:hypothetical protein
LLKKNTTLERLGLEICDVSARGARALGEALTENITLKELNLSRNYIGDDGAEAFAEALRANESLERIYLEGCGLTDVGASSLLAALRVSNSTLRKVFRYVSFFYHDREGSFHELLEENKAVGARDGRTSGPLPAFLLL